MEGDDLVLVGLLPEVYRADAVGAVVLCRDGGYIRGRVYVCGKRPQLAACGRVSFVDGESGGVETEVEISGVAGRRGAFAAH